MRFFIFTTALLVMSVSFAHADKLAKYKPPQSFEVTEDFYVIEGAGLFQSGNENALHLNLWKGSDRADITKLVKEMPANSKSPFVRGLIEAVLLSESDTEKLDDHDEVLPGDDLLTLRINKLMEGGFFKDALELYSVAIESPHHADIAKAGILAMLGSGEKSIACLEMKTLGNMNMGDSFWPAFMAYCNYTLSDRPSSASQTLLENSRYDILRSLAFNPKFVFPFTSKDWNSLDIIEQHVLMAEGRIEAPIINDALLENLSPRDLAVLLQLETFKANDRLKLLLLASEWGLVSGNDLIESYKDKNTTSQLAQLYRQLDAIDDEGEKNNLLYKVIHSVEADKLYALLPFASFFAESSLNDLTPEQMKSILYLFYWMDVTVELEIFENYTANHEKNAEHDAFLATMQAIPLVLKMPESHEFVINMQNIGIFHKNTQDKQKNVIENLDKDDLDVDNAVKVYEKGLDVAVQKEHDNASTELLEKLNKFSKRKILGETVLLSIKLLSDQSIRDADQELYSDNLNALKSVNLKEFSRKMAIERLLGD